jgi:hypothetical protein
MRLVPVDAEESETPLVLGRIGHHLSTILLFDSLGNGQDKMMMEVVDTGRGWDEMSEVAHEKRTKTPTTSLVT